MRTLVALTTTVLTIFLFACQQPNKKQRADGPRKIEILFLGHDSEHHNSAQYMPLLAAALAPEGINLTYTDKPSDLNPETLSAYDGLVLYANHDSITATQEAALLEFVEEGRGFIPIHCASFCFRNSEKFVNLVGGQFLKHDTGTFVASIINKEHFITKPLKEFSTWDETYVHSKLTADRTTLMERVEGDHHEPWTWVRDQGKGRVFYTAYGHDERTWDNPGFHQLVKQGIVWAVGDNVKTQWEEYRKTMPTLVYKDVPNIPNYEKRNPAPQYQEPLSAEESKKLIQVPAGFDLELFVSEPDIINPIAMDWDERGRLWVIETVDYPNTVRDDDGVGDDRIKICEDTDGDGKADKFTVFADNLNIPTSLVFANGGVIVSQAPHFLFLQDTNGDDKADVRKILIDGWGTFDTHAGPSNLKYGIDNHIWGTVGYSGFKGNIAGKAFEFSQGFYRFTPQVSDFEFMTKTSNNTWGLGLTETNDIFGSTANNTHSVFMGISSEQANGVEGILVNGQKLDGHYAMHPITAKVRQVDVFGGFTAAAGHNFYTARAYPKTFWNRVAFVCEPTGHLVHMARIEKDGAGFVEKDGWNLFAGADEWVSPVEAKVGPDGAVWVLDWYDFIIQHNPTPTPERGGYTADTGKGNAYENPLRDKSHGRVWRVVYRDAKPYTPIQLNNAKPNELVSTLGHDNLFWRTTAQRLLVERGDKSVVPVLLDQVKNQTTDEDGNNAAALHALWTLQGLGVVKEGDETFSVVTRALKHPSASVRKAAIQILSGVKWTEAFVKSSNILNDADPNTRMAAILSTTTLPPSDSIGTLLYAISKEEAITKDDWLAKAVYVAAVKHRDGFRKAYLREHADYKTPEVVVLKRETADFNDAAWNVMKLPQYIEKAGLEIDGLIWFRTTVDVPNNMVGKKASLSLGPIDDSDEVWLNGVKVAETFKAPNKPRVYEIPAGKLKAGKNSLAIKVEDTGGGGGLYGKADELFLSVGKEKITLAGDWKYDVEAEYSAAKKNIFQEVAIGEVFMKHYATDAATAALELGPIAKDATVIHIKVIKNQMKYDLKDFTVVAGKPVEVIFENPDFMQHNLVIAKQGTMKVVGAAADKLAADPKGAELNYVPAIPEVLFSTKLVNPQQTVRLSFVAPKEAGAYPYVCTFPGHWSIMNGTMNVVKSK
ncbi:PVC-type heme-binding CxxCH protein [Chryseolinea lacunae]|uniref:ThuA domain-containing protein n=1 Tax=Chryseolinea lacunae TaxID=2801331 RepID=A0ABS1KND2_9BACT|nr:PVC-type heme-binding CxxCH protein [Chryseolinea lacunae]MBL0740965.1 ThuA domain-containing protein [Chryseolinea lacunae]